MLPPGGDFIQFTYSLFSPVPRRELHLVGEPRATIVANFPPARVWVYRRVGGAALRSEASAGGRGIRLEDGAGGQAQRGGPASAAATATAARTDRRPTDRRPH